MLAGAFAAAAAAAVDRLGLARPLGRRSLLSRRPRAHPRLRLDHPSRQPDRLRRGHQLPRRRPDHHARQAWFQQGGRTPPLAGPARFLPIDLPLADRHRHGAVLGPIYRRRDLRPQPPRLSRPARGAARRLVGALPHPLRPAPARRRREPGRGRYRRHLGRVAALPRADHRRRPVRHRRRLSLDRPERRLRPRHDAGKGYHRARRADLRQVAAGPGRPRLPALRLPRRRPDPPAGRDRSPASARSRCSSSRRCPTC